MLICPHPVVSRLTAAAETLCSMIDNGEFFAGVDGAEPARERIVAAIDELQAARDDAHSKLVTASVNPFVRYRREILGYYSTAQRLASLVLHLYNSNEWTLDITTLLANADEQHTRIALACMAWYAQHGENDQVFMELVREILRRDHPELFEY